MAISIFGELTAKVEYEVQMALAGRNRKAFPVTKADMHDARAKGVTGPKGIWKGKKKKGSCSHQIGGVGSVIGRPERHLKHLGCSEH